MESPLAPVKARGYDRRCESVRSPTGCNRGLTGSPSFRYEVERSGGGLTGLAGLPAYYELAVVAGMRESVTRHVCARSGEQGWSDAESVLSLLLLNLAGGECVDDIEKLAGDARFRAGRGERRAALLGRGDTGARTRQLQYIASFQLTRGRSHATVSDCGAAPLSGRDAAR